MTVRYRVLRDGGRQILTFTIPGDSCDAHCFLLRRMDQSIGTIAPIHVSPVSRDRVTEIFTQHPRLAAVPFMVSELLGLRADGFAKRLHVRNPLLPDGVATLALQDLCIASARVSLGFFRRPDGASNEIIANESEFEVVTS